jgi:hypothetical protein
MINSTIDDINLEERLEEGPDKLPATLDSYQIYLRKFAKFVKIAGKYKINEPMIDKEFFNDDEIIAKYFLRLGDNNDKPHVIKSARAAIAYALSVHKLPEFSV